MIFCSFASITRSPLNPKLVGSYQFSDGRGRRIGALPGFDVISDNSDHRVTVSYHRKLLESFFESVAFSISTKEPPRAFRRNAGREGLLAAVGINGVSTLDTLDEGYPRVCPLRLP